MIYLVSYGNYVTGGPETMHQAAMLLANEGESVGMYYINPHTMNVPDRFKQYGVQSVDHIEDHENNIIIVPETLTYVLYKFHRIRKCIWWLSRDNYFNTDARQLVKWRMEVHHWPRLLTPIAWATLACKGKIHFNRYHFEDEGTYFHAYNCELAHQYLLENGVPEDRTLYLCGPLNEAFFEKAQSPRKSNRENIILYNPNKGIEFTDKIISAAKSVNLRAEFIALRGMTPDQISELMSRAKIYMDFGNFPGPERIPREAVTMGCNIITSRNGAAANNVDVPIPDELKFCDSENCIPGIINTLEDMLARYDEYYHYYDAYREKVVRQVTLFQENIKLFLERI